VDRPKRILIIADGGSPLDRERGLVSLKKGYQIFWYSFPKADLEGLADAIAPPWGQLRWFSFLFSPWFLKSAVKRVQPDLIHIFYAYHQLDNLVLQRFKPLVLTIMGGDILSDQGFHGKKKWLTRKLLRKADIITSKSNHLDRVLQEIGVGAHKIRRVTWGVDTKRFYQGMDVRFLREQWKIEPDEFIFFSPRNCLPLYQQDLIIKAFSEYQHLNGGRKKEKLLIAGNLSNGPYLRKLRSLVANLRLEDKVLFIGSIPHQEMPAYYNLADVMVAVPLSDGMPQSLYEAMACGTFPVLGDLPQYQEIIQDGKNGRLVRIGDISGLSAAMSWASAHSELRKVSAAFNRKRIMEVADKETQDLIMVSIYEELFEKYRE
jgi:glycosyltransferase involved in cell wall biosynthesis